MKFLLEDLFCCPSGGVPPRACQASPTPKYEEFYRWLDRLITSPSCVHVYFPRQCRLKPSERLWLGRFFFFFVSMFDALTSNKTNSYECISYESEIIWSLLSSRKTSKSMSLSLIATSPPWIQLPFYCHRIILADRLKIFIDFRTTHLGFGGNVLHVCTLTSDAWTWPDLILGKLSILAKDSIFLQRPCFQTFQAAAKLCRPVRLVETPKK